MADQRMGLNVGLGCLLAIVLCAPALRADTKDSARLERAKELIADEQWARAVGELKAAAGDPKETNKDEVLFWLAHSEHQSRDSTAAVDTIGRLEREYPRSRWVKPARSLRLEIAQRLRRSDVLWWTAAPPAPPAPPAVPASSSPTPVAAVPPHPPAPPASPARAPRPLRVPPHPPTPPTPVTPEPARAPEFAPPPPPALPAFWMPEPYRPDTDLRIQALGSLIRTDAARVIPMLKEIALESTNAGESRRALFILAQSGGPEARSTVVEVARTGSESVRIAAVRELGRVAGPGVSNDLLQVYSTANARVKYQVVTALGQRDATTALVRIVLSETDRSLRDSAIVTLGECGGLEELQMLYLRGAKDARRPIILGLFNAQAEDALIAIAERERDPLIRQEVLSRLRRLGTPRALQYLGRAKEK